MSFYLPYKPRKKKNMVLPSRKHLREDEAYREKCEKYLAQFQQIMQEETETEYYFDLVEHNDWEGENWHFYVSYPKAQKDMIIDSLRVLRKKMEKEGMGWSIDDYFMTKTEVDVLVEYSEVGYMAMHNIEGSVTAEDLKCFVNCDKCIENIWHNDGDIWYKGKFSFICPHDTHIPLNEDKEVQKCEGCGIEGDNPCESCDRSRCTSCGNLLKAFDHDKCVECR